MKRTLLIFAIALQGIAAISQVELKGIKLGYVNPENEITTTVGGVEGVVYANTINDGRAYIISFAPNDRISSVKAQTLITAIEKKYGVKLKRKDSYSDTYSASKGGYFYFVSADENQFMTPSTEFGFAIIKLDLNEINKGEQAAEAGTDF